MSYIKKTNLFKSIVFSRGMALVIIFVIVFMGYGLVSLMGKSIETSKARKLAETQAAALSDKEKTLSTELSALDTPDGQEAALREQFPVVKPGEHVVVITDDSKGDSIQAAPGAAPAEEDGFWNFLRNLFK